MPAHAHDAAAALGPARFVVIRVLRGGLSPGPAGKRSRKLARAPGALEEIAVDHHEELDVHLVQILAGAQAPKRRQVGERE